MIEENILSLIPQSHPFVMIDHLLFADEKISRTSFTIKSENIFFENGEFAEAGLLENIAQTAAAGAGFRALEGNKKVEHAYIGAVKKLQIFFLPKENDELITEVVTEHSIYNMTAISGKIYCQNLPVAQCEMKIFIAPND